MNLGAPEVILILVIGLLIFGPQKLPEMGQVIGRALRAYRQAVSGLEEEIRQEIAGQVRQTPPSGKGGSGGELVEEAVSPVPGVLVARAERGNNGETGQILQDK